MTGATRSFAKARTVRGDNQWRLLSVSPSDDHRGGDVGRSTADQLGIPELVGRAGTFYVFNDPKHPLPVASVIDGEGRWVYMVSLRTPGP